MAESAVLDASAVLALLMDEPGARQVAAFLPAGGISAVNLAEVLLVLERKGVPQADARHAVEALAIEVLPADAATAHAAAAVAGASRRRGLSLGDCFCIATASLADRRAVTADRSWAQLKVDARIVVVRG